MSDILSFKTYAILIIYIASQRLAATVQLRSWWKGISMKQYMKQFLPLTSQKRFWHFLNILSR